MACESGLLAPPGAGLAHARDHLVQIHEQHELNLGTPTVVSRCATCRETPVPQTQVMLEGFRKRIAGMRKSRLTAITNALLLPLVTERTLSRPCIVS